MAISASSPGRAASFSHAAVAVWAGLLALTALAWALTVRGALDMGNMPGTMGRSLPSFIGMWTVMMAAMMLPSVAPVGSLYVRTVRARSTGVAAGTRLATLVAGYLAVWAAFGVVAFGAAWGADRLAREGPGVAPWVGAVVLALCGLYQLTPLKERCLSHCRSPLGFLMHFGNYRGRSRDARVGVYHGAYCLGCCWSLMIVMVVVGVMNLAWMAALALVILLEKTWRYGKGLGVAFGVGLIGLAFAVPWYPGLLPGIHLDGGMPMPM